MNDSRVDAQWEKAEMAQLLIALAAVASALTMVGCAAVFVDNGFFIGRLTIKRVGLLERTWNTTLIAATVFTVAMELG